MIDPIGTTTDDFSRQISTLDSDFMTATRSAALLGKTLTSALEAIALRGHTPGSIAFATTDGDPVLLFTGDSLFPGGVGNTRNDPQRFEQLFADVSERLFDRFGDDAIVYPGHGAETTLGAERPALPEWRERGW